MIATDATVAQERERLRAALDGYAAEDIGAMLEVHSPGAGAGRRKAERVDRLAQLLTEPETARRAVSVLSPLARRLLGVVRRSPQGRVSLAALFLAGADPAGGDEGARRELEDLLARGLLVIGEREESGKVPLKLADPTMRLRWVWAPRTVLEALPAPTAADAPLLVPLGREPVRVERGSFALLRRDLYLALRFLKGTGLRLTRGGEPHRTDLRKLLGALQQGGAPPRREVRGGGLDGRLLFLVRLLDAAGLTRDHNGTLRTSEEAEKFLNLPEPEAARLLFDVWLDLDWNEFARLSHLVIDAWAYGTATDMPTRERLAWARRSLGELLASMPAGSGWFSIEAVADALRRTDPEFLISRLTEWAPNPYGSFGYGGSYYANQRLQEQAYYRGFVRAEVRGRDRRLRKDEDWQEVEGAFVAQLVAEPLLWLGIVDAGYDEPEARPEVVAPGRGHAARPTALRLTELGALVLADDEDGAPKGEPLAAGATLVVQPNFEVLVLDALGHLDLLARLDLFADAQGLDRAAVYRLTRPALVRGLTVGWTEERVVALLEAGSGAPLPQNVRHTLHDWAREYERVHLYRDATLLEAPDAATLDRWLADPALAAGFDRRLTPTAALLRVADTASLSAALERHGAVARTINYALDAPQVLAMPAPGRIVVAPEDDDPYLRYGLNRFADLAEGGDAPGPVSYVVTPPSLARARETGLTIDGVLSFLGYKARGGLSPDDIVTLRGWAGSYAPFRYARVRAVELPPGANWGDLGRVKALRPLILRVLSANLALVDEEHWPKLEAALAARGIALEAGLNVQPAADKRSAAQRAAAEFGLTTGRELLDVGIGDPAAPRARGGRRGASLHRLAGRALTDFIEEALDGDSPLLIEYQKPSERRSTLRVVDPLGLEMRGGVYYLHAFCRLRGEERNFRLANILGAALADE